MESIHLPIELSIRTRRMAIALVWLQAWPKGDFGVLLAQTDHIKKDPPALGASKGSDEEHAGRQAMAFAHQTPDAGKS